jgi:ADP-ribose pyrophosphatase YjhB (NUDIX family)
MQPKWLSWARELQATAQIGLAYCENPYDRERYEAIRALAVRMMTEGSDADMAMVEGLFAAQTGYATPKVDVRGAVFRGREVLLVSELMDGGRWTMPGGWADVNATPAENVVREVREEAGYVVTVKKLAAVYDRDVRGHPHPYPFHIYKLFFLCDITGECERSPLETSDARFFPIDDLPPLSESRVLPSEVLRLYEHLQTPSLPTDFD